jgi:mono/diheme cytochrome c family protein
MRAATIGLLSALLVAIGGCRGGNPAAPAAFSVATLGDPAHGRTLIEEFKCGACHTIPGVSAARGVLASPLFWFSRRSFIAGEVPNTPPNLVKWVLDPRAIEPRTAMPAVGLDEEEARDVAAYLYTLR